MARLALLLSSCWLVFSCSKPQLTAVNVSDVFVKTGGGITFVNEQPFTGILFELNGLTSDTLWMQSFQKGREDAMRKEYYENKQVKEIRYFRNGKKEGMMRAWWPNGKLKSEYHFKDGEYHGLNREWSNEGKLVSSKNYKQGNEDGLQQMWTHSGKVWANYVVKNGRNYGITGIKGCATLWQADSIRAH